MKERDRRPGELRFGHLEIFVRDPGRARDFYERTLGFELEEVQGESFIWLRKRRVTVLLRPGDPPPATSSYEATSKAIVLYTDDLAGSMARLREEGVEPRGTDGSEKCPTFTDPDGNWFQLVDPRDH